MRVTLIWVLVVAILGVAAAEDPLAKAARLREEGAEAFEARRWLDAVEKYAEAERIYAESGEKYLADRVTLLRAICWNYTNAAKHDECRSTWLKLAELAAGSEAFAADVASAYVAVATSSEKLKDIETQIAYLTVVREAAVRLKHEKTAAQVLHDMAHYLAVKDLLARAVPLLETAVVERRKIRDLTGLAWSLKNLGVACIHLGRTNDGLPRLKEAFGLVHGNGVRDAQAGIAAGIRAAIETIGDGPASRDMQKFLWEIAFMSAEAAAPAERAIPASYLLRTAIAADPDAGNLGRAGRLELAGLPDEVRADVRITVARAWLAAGKKSNAARLLKKLPVGEGPAAPHLAARLATVNALVAAAGKKKRDFRESTNRAAEAWRSLGEIDGMRAAFVELVEAVRRMEMEEDFRDLIAEQKRQANAGQPGGLGSSAQSAGDRSGYGALGPRDPLFEIRAKDGGIVITDLLAKSTATIEVKWMPRATSLNGVTFWTFGGYVKIVTFAYGGAAVSSGTPASIPLSELGEYLPVPAKGRIVVQKNGSFRYE